jgi:UDP-GlcNAc:undecaprenyl-phosphate GlcNAc-1-phosphate transferase
LYYGEVFPRTSVTGVSLAVDAAVAVTAILVILAIRCAGEAQFQTTPLDYLIVLLAGIMPFLPEVTVGDVSVGGLAAKLIVLFFAFELLLHIQAWRSRLAWLALAMLSGVILRVWGL